MLEAIVAGNNESGKQFINSEFALLQPFLFLIQEENLSSGIMISASHNPPEYNGIKSLTVMETKLPKNLKIKEKLVQETTK